MKFPSLLLFFLLCKTFSLFGQINTYPYVQSFESSFLTGKNVEFLPGWSGNEVSEGNSRIYQAGASNAHSGEAALGIVPTGTFTGEILIYFDAASLAVGQVSFWARSGENGSGTRPSTLTISFSADGGESFTQPQLVGDEGAFPNANSSYQQYQFELSGEVLGHENAVLRLRLERGGSGEGAAARIFLDDFNINSEAPAFRLLSAEVGNENNIRLYFNRELELASAERESNYKLNGGVSITAAALNTDVRRQVLLNTSSLKPGNTYILQLGNVQDIMGNSAEGQTVSLTYTENYELRVYDLLISEIHAAPNEQTLLPNVEWVEIYNASDRAIELKGLRFSDEGRSAPLPAHVLGAGEYIVLAPAADAASLEPYGSVLGLSSWPSLNNDADQLSLISPGGRLIDRIAYSQSWYGSSEKAQGGWSLERIDLNNPCAGAANWSVAVASAGGTPAAMNSIAASKPDLTGPELLQAYAADSLTIQLLFNEPLDTTSFSLNWFQIQPDIAVEAVHVLQQDGLELMLTAPLSSEITYILAVSNIQDCSGNLLQEVGEIAVAFPKPAADGDVVINEVMFDPPPTSEEYVELANASHKYINLQNWQLATYNQGIKSTSVLSREVLLLPPQGFLVFSRSPEAVQTAFPSAPFRFFVRLPGLPVLPNGGDSIALFNEQGAVMDIFGYSEKLHTPFIQETKGVSLERISPAGATNEAGNWTSAASTSNYGTPGQLNSQALLAAVPKSIFEITPEILEPGNNGFADFAAIRLLNERQGLMANLRVLDEQGQEVKVLANNQLIGREAFFSWSGTNEAGRPVRTGYYIVVLQLHDATGFQKIYRKTIVVGNELK
jgi:hypothetical protein